MRRWSRVIRGAALHLRADGLTRFVASGLFRGRVVLLRAVGITFMIAIYLEFRWSWFLLMAFRRRTLVFSIAVIVVGFVMPLTSLPLGRVIPIEVELSWIAVDT